MDGSDRADTLARLEATLRGVNYLMNFLSRHYLREEGLTLPRFWVLLHLAAHRTLTMGELQEKLLISPGSVTALVDGLEAEGLVERRRDCQDRRVVNLGLSPTGAERLERVLSFRQTLVEEAFPHSPEIERLVTLLEEAQRRLQAITYGTRRRPPAGRNGTTQRRGPASRGQSSPGRPGLPPGSLPTESGGTAPPSPDRQR